MNVATFSAVKDLRTAQSAAGYALRSVELNDTLSEKRVHLPSILSREEVARPIDAALTPSSLLKNPVRLQL
jgi:hypothetical protein